MSLALTVAVEVAVTEWKQGAQMVDVRSASEFRSGHVAGARNIPLEELAARLDDLNDHAPIVFVCQSGQRAELAADRIAKYGVAGSVLQGGMNAWKRAGHPIVVTSRTGWSLERQVRLVAGSLLLAGLVLTLIFSRNWLYLVGFVGLGLTMAGLTDSCPMAKFLTAMPWNGTRK